MFHNCTWLQIVFFEIGALFQFMAVCAYLRERIAGRHDESSHEPDPDYHDTPQPAPRPQVSIEQQVAAYRVLPAPPTDESDKTGASAANLLRTAKVKFKQSFKSRAE